MKEREPVIESYPPMKLDEHLFDNLTGVAEHIENKDNRTLLEEIIGWCKKRSLEYAEETLDVMLGKTKPKEEKKEEEMTEAEKRWLLLGGKDKEPSHQIISCMVGLGLLMKELGIPKDNWPKYDPNEFKHQQQFRNAALQYAFGEALRYEKLTLGGRVDKGKALEELGLKDVVDADFMERHIVQKIDKLPVEIKEHIVE